VIADTLTLQTATAAASAIAVSIAVGLAEVGRRRSTKTLAGELAQWVAAQNRLRSALTRTRTLSRVELTGLDLHGAVLRDVDLREADLSRSVLAGVDLSGADCSRARMKRTDLSGAKARTTNFTEADLGGAQLSGAQLFDAVLVRANLLDADLTDADLTNADFSDALLAGADLRGARVDGATFSGADLSGARMPLGLAADVEPVPRLASSRPLSVYFVTDRSASMSGAPIEAANRLLKDTILQVKASRNSPPWISILSFSDAAEVVLPLTQASDIAVVPELYVDRHTAYGPAFQLLHDRLRADARTLRGDGLSAGDSIVFFITDGVPIDSGWQAVLAALQEDDSIRPPKMVAVGVGDAEPEVLKTIGTAGAVMATERASTLQALREVRALVTSSVSALDQGQILQIEVPPSFRIL
jgi:uncharacterized protein YjbI with pentapeptide repeats